MTDHRRRAEELVNRWCVEVNGDLDDLPDFIESALKEVEEETWERAVGVVEKRKRNTGMKGSASQLLDIEVDQILSALREEAAKK